NSGGRIIFFTDAGFFPIFKRTKIMMTAIIVAPIVLAIPQNMFLSLSQKFLLPIISSIVALKTVKTKPVGKQCRHIGHPIKEQGNSEEDHHIATDFNNFHAVFPDPIHPSDKECHNEEWNRKS